MAVGCVDRINFNVVLKILSTSLEDYKMNISTTVVSVLENKKCFSIFYFVKMLDADISSDLYFSE